MNVGSVRTQAAPQTIVTKPRRTKGAGGNAFAASAALARPAVTTPVLVATASGAPAAPAAPRSGPLSFAARLGVMNA